MLEVGFITRLSGPSQGSQGRMIGNQLFAADIYKLCEREM
jgi:hypothetical protein